MRRSWINSAKLTVGAKFNQGRKGIAMVKVKTFATELKIFHTIKELTDLDDQINQFIQENNISKVVSVSDSCTTDDKGATIGLIRVVAYE